MKTCEDCGKKLVKHTARWCKEHGYKHRERPSGLKYKIVKENPSWFKKGHVSWHKGTKGLLKQTNPTPKGTHRSPKTEFKPGDTKGEKNVKWKGSKVGYHALHSWLIRNYGKADKCEHCGSNKKIEWSNRTGFYFRQRDDWIKLCHKCHVRYDIKRGSWGDATLRFKL